jgi:hypothetical protein
MPGYPADKQLKMASKMGVVIEYDTAVASRDNWIRSLRPGQIGWVARLAMLADPMTKGGPRPSRDFAVTIAAVMRRVGLGARVIEGETGITSDDEKAFAEAIGRAADKVAAGRRLTARQARKMGEAARLAAIEKSPVRRWKSKEMAREFKRFGAMWRDPIYNETTATEAINATLIEEGKPALGSHATMRRIWGPRVPAKAKRRQR